MLELESAVEEAALNVQESIFEEIQEASSEIYRLRPHARTVDPDSIEGGRQIHTRIVRLQHDLDGLGSEFVILQKMQHDAVLPRIPKHKGNQT